MSTAVTIAAVELVHAQHAAALDAANRKLEWLARITTPQEIDSLLTEADLDEIDEFVGEFSPSQTKSGKEISRLLNLLDNLPTGKYSQ